LYKTKIATELRLRQSVYTNKSWAG